MTHSSSSRFAATFGAALLTLVSWGLVVSQPAPGLTAADRTQASQPVRLAALA